MCSPQLHGGRPLIGRPRAGHARPLSVSLLYHTSRTKAKLLHAVQRNIIDDLTGADQTGDGGDVGVAAGDLAVQVRQADLVIIDQVQRADVCQPCKV